MRVYRLSKKKYREDLSGRGAEIAGGRWNSIGVALLYTGENRALCTAEIAVHTPLGVTPQDYYLITIALPNVGMKEIRAEDLEKNWRTFPHQPYTKTYGDDFVRRNEHLILKVPSAVIQGEYNYLINPKHPHFQQVKIVRSEPFVFDKRLFEKG